MITLEGAEGGEGVEEDTKASSRFNA